MLLWRKGGREICKYMLTPFFRNSSGLMVRRVPRDGGELGFVKWQSYRFSSTPIPVFDVGTAQESCTAVGTNCNSLRKVFISTTTHGYQMCWRARERRGEASREGRETSSFIWKLHNLPFVSKCIVLEKWGWGGERSLGRWNALLFTHSVEAEWNSLSSSKYQNFCDLSLCWKCFTFSVRVNENYLDYESSYALGWLRLIILHLGSWNTD